MITTENTSLLVALDQRDVLIQADSSAAKLATCSFCDHSPQKHSAEHAKEIAQEMKMLNFISMAQI